MSIDCKFAISLSLCFRVSKDLPDLSLKGDVRATQILLNNLSNEDKLDILNKLNKDGKTALHLACQRGESSIVKLFMDTADEINALEAVIIQEGKDTPVSLLLACENGHAGIVQTHLEKIRTLPNMLQLMLPENIDGDTTLHFAARGGHINVVEALLKNDDDSNVHRSLLLYRNNHGYTPLVTACIEGYVNIIATILAKAEDLNMKDQLLCLEYTVEELAEGGKVITSTCLGFACMTGQTSVVKAILNAATKPGILDKLLCLGVSPFMLALIYKHTDVVKAIIQAAAQSKDPFAVGPTHNWLPLHSACAEKNTEIVVMILDIAKEQHTGSSGKQFVCRQNKDHMTALHIACKLGHTEIAEKVMDFAEHMAVEGELIKQRDGNGLNCLHYACISENEECVTFLLDKADKANICKDVITHNDDQGFTALSYAYTQRKDIIISVLLDKAEELDCSEDVFYHKDEKGLCVVHHACEDNDTRMLGLLITKAIEAGIGPDVTLLQDNHNHTGLHLACNRGHIETADILCTKAFQLGISKPFLFLADDNGLSALHCAAQHGLVPVVQLLLTYAMDLGVRTCKQLICLRDCDGWTAMDLASKKDLESVQKILMAKAERLKTVPNMCFPLREKGTSLHAACCGTSVNIVNRIMNSKVLSVEKLLLQEDEDGDTALSVACSRNKKLIQKAAQSKVAEDIIDVLLDYAKQYHVAEVLLCHENNKHENALTLACIKEGNERTARRLFKLAMELKLYKVLDKTQIEHMPQLLLEQFDKLYDEVALTIDVTKKADISDVSKLFVTHEKNLSFTQITKSSLLTKIGESGKEELITHQFTQLILALYWQKYAAHLFFGFFAVYILFMTSFTCVINNNYFVNTNGTITVVNDHTHFNHASVTITICLACLEICFEIWQLLQKRWYYIRSRQNYLDMFVYVSAIMVSILMVVEDEHRWSHILATVSVFAGWVNAAVILRSVPNFGFRFVMLFSVLWNVILFLPVLAIFIFGFALVFHNLAMNQDQYENIGKSIIKTMVMSIGEVDYLYMFYTSPNPTPFEIISHIMFAICLAIMTISVMNLLIGVAIGDVVEVKRTSKVRAFVTLSDLVLEYRCLYPWLVRKLWKGTIKKRDFLNLAIEVKSTEESQKNDRMAKELYKIEDKIEILSNNLKDLDIKLQMKYETVDKKLKVNLEQMQVDLIKRITNVEAHLKHVDSKSDHIKNLVQKIKLRSW